MYETDQPQFLNAVAMVQTDADPLSFLGLLMAIEQDLGRVRSRRFGPRLVDLDIILWGSGGQTIVRHPELEVPHPRAAERPFVMLPLAELAPGIGFPGAGRSVVELSRSLGSGNLARIGGPGWANEPTALGE